MTTTETIRVDTSKFAAARLRSELLLLYEHKDERLGDHKYWMARIKRLLDETADYGS